MAWPAPEVPARLASDGETPAGARRMTAHARAHGWTVVATYARGTWPGRTPRVIDSLALRMVRTDDGARHRAVAVWQDGRFHSAYTWSGEQPLAKHTATALRAALSGAGSTVDGAA